MYFAAIRKEAVSSFRKKLREIEGLPARGVSIGSAWQPPEECLFDENNEPIDTLGWAVNVVDTGIEHNGIHYISIPEKYAIYAPKVLTKEDLPVEVLAIVEPVLELDPFEEVIVEEKEHE